MIKKTVISIIAVFLTIVFSIVSQGEAEASYVMDAGIPTYYKSIDVPNEEESCLSEKKTYMYHTAITDKTSNQYQLFSKNNWYIDEYGLCKLNGRYLIALGTGYEAKVGDNVTLVLGDGTNIYCTIGDIKDDKDTDNNNLYNVADGSVAEFIVDKQVFKKHCDQSGTVNFVNGLSGEILSVSVEGTK